jgi:hypothetical protein
VFLIWEGAFRGDCFAMSQDIRRVSPQPPTSEQGACVFRRKRFRRAASRCDSAPNLDGRSKELMQRFYLLFGALLGALSSGSSAQDLAGAGFQLVNSAQMPVSPDTAYATLPNGERIEARATTGSATLTLVRTDAAGQVLATLLNYQSGLSSTIYTSFVRLSPAGTHVLVGESSDGNVWRVAVDGSSHQLAAQLAFNFDAVFESETVALLSEASCGYPCNRITRLDLISGALTTLAQFNTYSGPLARRAASGELYYGWVDPTFAGFGDKVLRFSAAQLASGNVLNENDGALFVGGLNGLGGLAVEERYDSTGYGHHYRVLIAESGFFGGSTVRAHRPDGSLESTLLSSPMYISTLEIQHGAAAGALARYQPDDGALLRYKATDYSVFPSPGALTCAVRPQRPLAQMSGPGLGAPGPVSFDLSAAPANASCLLIVSPVALGGAESTRWHPADFLWHTTMSWNSLRRLVSIPTDASGSGSFSFFNSGTIQGQYLLQALVRDSGGSLVGSSNVVQN